MNKIEARAGVLGHGEDNDYQAYLVYLDFLDDWIENVEKWDKFLDEVNNSKNNVVKITIEREE